MCISCSNAKSLGDSATRMIICKDTNKPKALFLDIELLIRRKAELLCMEFNAKGIDMVIEYLTMLAYDFLMFKYKEKTIYYCEDYFHTDLWKYFNETLKFTFENNEITVHNTINN